MSGPCASCVTARCCHVFDPELTGPDVARLASALGLSPEHFATLAPVHADAVGPDGVRLGGAETWELRLARAADAPARRCVFLMALAPGVHRCAVHPVRPAICRIYPSDLTRFGVMIATPADVCPPDAFAPERVDLAPFRAAHAEAATERLRWRAFLAAWNAPEAQARWTGQPTQAARSAFFEAILAAESPWALAAPAPTAPSGVAAGRAKWHGRAISAKHPAFRHRSRSTA